MAVEITLIILAVAIVISLILIIVLPWWKDYQATMVLSIAILSIFIIQFVLTSDFSRHIPLLGDHLTGNDDIIWKELGFVPVMVIENLEVHRFITPLLLHADFVHLAMNMAGLIFLGVQFENRIGWKRFLLIFFGTGVAANAIILPIAQLEYFDQSLGMSSIGASGAIFGILSAYWYMYPREKVFFPLLLIRKWPLSLIILIYGGLNIFMLIYSPDDNVNYFAHVAGIIAGMPMAVILKPSEKTEVKKLKKLDKAALFSMANTKRKREVLERALEAGEEDVRDAWLEDFFERVKCEKCGHRGMKYDSGTAKCTSCGHRIKP